MHKVSFDIKHLTVEQLILFQHLYKERSVSRIAGTMNTTQSTVSRKLATLRELTGDQLFVPQKEGMSPTLYAKRIHPSVSDALEILESTFGSAGKSSNPRDYEYNIGIVDTAIHLCVSKLINHCSAEGTNLSLTFDPIDEDNDPFELKSVINKLKTGELDYSLHTNDALYGDRSIEGVEVFSSAYVLISKKPRRASAVFPERIGLDDFLELSFADTDPIPIRRFLERKGKTRNIRALSPNHSSTVSIIKDSNLFGLIPEVLTKALLNRGDNIRITPLDFNPPELRVSLFWLKKNRLVSYNRWMRLLIQHQCESI